MITINKMTDEAISKLYKDNGAFFAFGDKQLAEGLAEAKKNGFDIPKEDYRLMFGGLCCPLANCKKVSNSMTEIYAKARKEQVKKYGKDAIIEYELSNHEYCITWDITDTWRAVCGYEGFTKEDVQRVANKHY